ncbi:MAG: alkylhydroperoxidase, partial [Rhizobacter sp.]|nr:alkylhydroperoxidase [Chlorobiales bacterium]
MIETRKDFLTDLGLPEANYSGLEAFVKGDHKYIRDLRVNLKTTLDSPNLGGKKNAYMIALAVAVNEKSAPLVNSFAALAQKEGATEAEIAEIHACVSLLASLNVFYRFKHFAENKHYDTLQAGIKMTIMARPVLGKLFFETVALVVSAVNGCEICVNNHEKSIRSEGGSQ